MDYAVIDLKGKIVKVFSSKNQAEKYKKALRDAGKYGYKVAKQ